MAVGNIMQFLQLSSAVSKVSTINDQKLSNASSRKEGFGTVFSQLLQGKEAPKIQSSDVEQSTMECSILNAFTLKEALEELGFEMDDSLLFAVVDGEMIPTDDLLSSDVIATLLNLDLNDLSEVLAVIMDGEINIQNIWDVIENGPTIIKAVEQALAEGELPVQDAKDLMQFLKMASLIGEQKDTVLIQHEQIQSLTASLNQFNQQVKAETPSQTAVNLIASGSVKVQQLDKLSNSSNAQNEGMMQQNLQSNNLTRPISIVLPNEQSSQAEQLAKEVANIMSKSILTNQQGSIKLMLKLFPENLGHLRIEIMQQNGVLTARILASTTAGKELLESSMQQLKTHLATQNIQMERIDVTQALSEPDRNFRDQNMFNNFTKNHEQENAQEDMNEDEEGTTFKDYLEEEVFA